MTSKESGAMPCAIAIMPSCAGSGIAISFSQTMYVLGMTFHGATVTGDESVG